MLRDFRADAGRSAPALPGATPNYGTIADAGCDSRSQRGNRKWPTRGGDIRRYAQAGRASPARAGSRGPTWPALLRELRYPAAAHRPNGRAGIAHKRRPPRAEDTQSRGPARPADWAELPSREKRSLQFSGFASRELAVKSKRQVTTTCGG